MYFVRLILCNVLSLKLFIVCIFSYGGLNLGNKSAVFFINKTLKHLNMISELSRKNPAPNLTTVQVHSDTRVHLGHFVFVN